MITETDVTSESIKAKILGFNVDQIEAKELAFKL